MICSKNEIKVSVMSNHPLIKLGLKSVVENSPHLCVYVGEVNNDYSQELKKAHPHVVVLDTSTMSFDASITHSISELKSLFNNDVFIILVTDESVNLANLFRTGAAGFILSQETCHGLGQAIQMVTSGVYYYSPKLTEKMAARIKNDTFFSTHAPTIQQLTRREKEVLTLVRQKMTDNQIAVKLTISYYTVRSHISTINAKLGFNARLAP